MANTFFGLNIGTLGIHAANAQLNVTANNIANEHSEGYSRQVAKQQATQALRVHQSYGMIGSGVEVTSIDRMRNEYYDVKYQENQTRYGESNARLYYMKKIEDLFNEAKVDGFTEEFDNLYASIHELIGDPSNITARNTYLNYAESFLEYLQEIKSDLKLEQEDLNAEISNNVSKINSLAEELATINKQINVVELAGSSANELRDRRSLILDELSQIVDITTSEKNYDNGKSEFTVKIGGATLVDNYSYFTLKVESREESLHDQDVTGLYDIKWSFGEDFDPVAQGIGGTLKGLLEIRDGNNGVRPDVNGYYPVDYKGVPYYINKIDEFLEQFTSAFNEIHATGTDLYGNGNKNDADTTNDDTEPLFIKSEQGTYMVNPKIKEDPKLLTTAVDYTDGESQNDLIHTLLKTKDSEIYNGGPANEYLNSIVTEIAIDTRKNKNLAESYENLGVSIQNQRLSVMGVDKDEEAMNLMKFQEMYELNAKVISIMTEIYDVLIRETGV